MMLAPFDVKIVVPSRVTSSEQRRKVASANDRARRNFYACDVQNRREPVEVGHCVDDLGPGFDHAGPAHGGRRAQRSVKDVRALILWLARAGIGRAIQNVMAVAFVPDAMMANVISVVAGE